MANVGPFTIRVFGVFIALVTLALPAVWADRFGLSLTPAQLDWVGARIYQNECASRPECLVHWNEGEAFPSLGIGHFIWYPGGVDGPFVESFPGLVRFARQAGAAVPDWLAELSPMDAPWSDRSGYLAAQSEPRMASLRQWLADTRGLQVAYILDRAQASLAQVVAAAPASQQASLSRRLEALVATAGGSYALIDYVNFKGEGLAPGEAYQGQGWGLLQVLQQMAHYEALPALDAFRLSAADVLTRRAENAERDIERERWLPGWLNRLETYQEP